MIARGSTELGIACGAHIGRGPRIHTPGKGGRGGRVAEDLTECGARALRAYAISKLHR